MSTIKKGMLTIDGQWAKHLKKDGKRQAAKRERKAASAYAREVTGITDRIGGDDMPSYVLEDGNGIPAKTTKKKKFGIKKTFSFPHMDNVKDFVVTRWYKDKKSRDAALKWFNKELSGVNCVLFEPVER